MVNNPEDMNLVYDTVFNSGDVEAVLALYEPDAKLILDSGQEVAGLDAIRSLYQDWLAMKGTMQSRTLYCVQQSDIALLRTEWFFTGMNSEGTLVELHRDAVEVLRRQLDGTWRYVIDHTAGASLDSDS